MNQVHAKAGLHSFRFTFSLTWCLLVEYFYSR